MLDSSHSTEEGRHLVDFFFSLLAFPQPPVTELFTPTPLLAVRPAVLFGKWEPARARARMSAHA
jgi:hypothetical protein